MRRRARGAGGRLFDLRARCGEGLVETGEVQIVGAAWGLATGKVTMAAWGGFDARIATPRRFSSPEAACACSCVMTGASECGECQ